MRHRREIDGLRALAVLPVMLFHAGVPGFSGGYVGVDVFFVISGYLITSLILVELAEDRFSLVDFYARRARRILPALVTVILACLPLAWLWMMPNQLRDFAQSIAAMGLFSSNLLFWSEEGYFASAAEEKPLLHTWSLAVEEQYYLLFPLLMLLGWRHLRHSLPLAIALLAAASFALAEWSWRHLGGESFYLPQLRIWELMIGALCAFYLRRRPPLEGAAAATLTLAGLLAIAFAVRYFDDDTPFPSAWTLLPTVGTALVILGATPGNALGRLLAWPTLVGIGLISYSAYLWHHPLFAFARLRSREEPSAWLLSALGLLALGLAWLSWRYIELPCRDRRRFPRRRVLALGGTASAVLLALGVSGHLTDGLPQRLEVEQRVEYERLRMALGKPRFDDGACRYSAERIDDAFVARFERCAAAHGRAVLIVGDSHGTDLYNALAKNAAVPFVVGVTQDGCRPHDRQRRCHYADVEHFLGAHAEQVRALLYTQKGSYFLRDYRDLPINEGDIAVVQTWLRELPFDGEVHWVGPRMEPRIDLRNLNVMVHRIEPTDAARDLDVLYALDRRLLAANRAAGVSYLSTITLVNYRFERDFLVDGRYSFSDGDHWSNSGERLFGARLLRHPVLFRLLGDTQQRAALKRAASGSRRASVGQRRERRATGSKTPAPLHGRARTEHAHGRRGTSVPEITLSSW